MDTDDDILYMQTKIEATKLYNKEVAKKIVKNKFDEM